MLCIGAPSTPQGGAAGRRPETCTSGCYTGLARDAQVPSCGRGSSSAGLPGILNTHTGRRALVLGRGCEPRCADRAWCTMRGVCLWNAEADEPFSAVLRARSRPPPSREVDRRVWHHRGDVQSLPAATAGPAPLPCTRALAVTEGTPIPHWELLFLFRLSFIFLSLRQEINFCRSLNFESERRGWIERRGGRPGGPPAPLPGGHAPYAWSRRTQRPSSAVV